MLHASSPSKLGLRSCLNFEGFWPSRADEATGFLLSSRDEKEATDVLPGVLASEKTQQSFWLAGGLCARFRVHSHLLPSWAAQAAGESVLQPPES